MTQVGEGRGAAQQAPAARAFGAPTVGEILAERYQLEQHVNTDSAGRQVWQGVDVILRRPVAVVMRYPGGPPAAQMLQTAVEASRIVHPNLVGVYDAIDEGTRAYVVREWVDGASLRDHIAAQPFDGERAVAVAHAVAAAVTAVHSTGMTHGNVHPGTVLIGSDGRVVLADGRADGQVPPEEDVRAVGGLIYFSLTGCWPQAEVGPTALPDAPRDPNGALASPRQIRAGVPNYLDDLSMDLLDRRVAVPPAEVLTGELARLDASPEEPFYAEAGPLNLVEHDAPAAAPKPAGRKIALGVAALLAVGVIGLLVAVNYLVSPSGGNDPGVTPPTDAPATPTAPGGSTGQPTPIPLTPAQVRVVDPPDGDRTELAGVDAVVDGDTSTGWRTSTYFNNSKFGLIKPGIGILIDLGEARHVASVKVDLSASGVTAELRTGAEDPGDSSSGDQAIHDSYTTIGEPFVDYDATTMVFSAFDADTTYQYLLVWISELPRSGDDGFGIEVLEISVEGP